MFIKCFRFSSDCCSHRNLPSKLPLTYLSTKQTHTHADLPHESAGWNPTNAHRCNRLSFTIDGSIVHGPATYALGTHRAENIMVLQHPEGIKTKTKVMLAVAVPLPIMISLPFASWSDGSTSRIQAPCTGSIFIGVTLASWARVNRSEIGAVIERVEGVRCISYAGCSFTAQRQLEYTARHTDQRSVWQFDRKKQQTAGDKPVGHERITHHSERESEKGRQWAVVYNDLQ